MVEDRPVRFSAEYPLPLLAKSDPYAAVARSLYVITSCEDDDDQKTPDAAAVGVGDAVDVARKMPCRQTMQASVGLNKHSQLEIGAFCRPQPVKLWRSRNTCEVLISVCISLAAALSID